MFHRRIFTCCLILSALAGMAHSSSSSSSNSTASGPSVMTLAQITDKLLSKFRNQVLMARSSRGYDYGYLDGYASDISAKSDYSWIVPLIIVIGFGTLLIPLMGTLMTTMMTQGTINLTAGRRKRSTTSHSNFIEDLMNTDMEPILKRIESAIKNFRA